MNKFIDGDALLVVMGDGKMLLMWTEVHNFPPLVSIP
jgi:hypothetical protein